jgi:tRNA A37 threonylcarbamoyladenosine modification protein TsaB
LKLPAPIHILGFDTSGAHCAVALMQDGVIIEKAHEDMAKGQAERVMGLIDEVMGRNRISYADLAAIGIGIGPGNFTGIRIGVSAARGLTLGLGIPAYGVNGFDQRALCYPDAPYQCVPAPRDQMYVRSDGAAALQPRAMLENIHDEPVPSTLAASVARVAHARFPEPTPAPAPYYLRAPDAAPAKDAPPKIRV